MGGKNNHYKIFSLFLYVLGSGLLIRSFKEVSIWNPFDRMLLLIFTIGYISICMMPIIIGKGNGHIDLSDSIITFVFIIFGGKVAVIFTVIGAIIVQTINITLGLRKVDVPRSISNVLMYIISAFGASKAAQFILDNFQLARNIKIALACIGFVGTFLVINIIVYKLDRSLRTGRYLRFNKVAIKLLILNFILSSMLSLSLSVVHKSSGIIGSMLVLGNLVILHYCLYIYRKLQIRNELIKGLLTITNDIVKHGDFRDKCKDLILNLKKIIPYNICSIYTFNVDDDTIAYPIEYYGPDEISITELAINLSETGRTAKTIKEGKIYISSDVKKDKRIKVVGKISEFVDAVIIVPIMIGNKAVGTIMISGGSDLVEFARNGINDILNILSNQMALAIENDEIYRDIKNKADVDSLTKLYNRRVFDREVDALIKSNIPFSMAIYDIDNFKQINDNYGHLAGDEVLRNISKIVRQSIRKTDIPCRYGGEEIVIIFKDLAKEDAYIISERIRENIETSSTKWNGDKLEVTVSGGIASYPDDGTAKEDVIKNADYVLYSECKIKGKNKVCAYRLKPNNFYVV